MIAQGIDPVAEKKKDSVVTPTFRAAAKPARRRRQRIGAVLDWEYVTGFRDSEAPMHSL